MKKLNPHWTMSVCLAAALTLFGSLAANAAGITTAAQLTASLTQRPLTPTEIKTYGLTGTNAQFSAGIGTVALGEPVYVDAMVAAAAPMSNIVGIAWSLTKPVGSSAALSAGPLGANVPLYKTADRISGENSTPVFQLAGRTFFRPDFVGQYTVTATITNQVGSGSPTTTNLVINITGATYLGVQTCAACHSGSFAGVPSIYPTFTNTLHASFFTRAVDGLVSSHYGKNCISCHTLGYDTNSFAVNGGFDDKAATYGWTFPTVLTNGNWAAMPSDLQNLANIQCENCHGPGSQHLYSQGVVGNTNAITVSYAAGDCGQCHDSANNHIKNAEWNNSLHSRSAREPSPQCVRCHQGPGFIGWATAGGMAVQNLYPTNIIAANRHSTNILTTPANTAYEAITCQACHDPHDASNPHQLRMGYDVTLSDGTVVTNAGSGGFCMQCHNSRNGSVVSMMAKYPLNQPNWAGGVGFGVHDSPQGDMLEGVNAITYGKVIPSAPHANVVSNTCAGCHMQPVASTDPAFLKAGGHTFKMSYTNSVGVEIPVTTVCAQCHGNVTEFDFPVADYNGDGVIEGVQTEVHHLLDKLSTLMPNNTYRADGKYVADGLVKVIDRSSFKTNWPAKFLNAGYNYNYVYADNSFGIHNAPFAVGLLKASIGDLTGDANNDGLPDAWQTQYFGAGFATNPAAAYTAINNTNGIPNWMMYALGLAPNASFKVGNSGVIYFNGNNIVNGDTNSIAIYTAAEVAFNTVVGTTYQIQGIDALTGSWQNISTNIPGTGGTISYVTPTRGTAQMFFRVVHTP